MPRSVPLLLVLALHLACASSPSSRGPVPGGLVPVGVARIDITPEEPIRLTGYGNRSAPSEGVQGRLWAKALAFGGRAPAVLIAVDVIGVPRGLSEELAKRLAAAGIRREQLAVTATHTHNGPALTGVLPFIFPAPVPADQQAVIDRYSRTLVDKLEQVARAALADRQPSTIGWAVGRAGFAANRRVLKEGRWVAFGVTPDGVVDHDLPVLAVRGANGTLRAVLASYACHATTLEGKQNFVHGDWPGAAQALIEAQHPGVVALVTIGAGADANPNPRGGGLPHVDQHAREVAAEVGRLLGGPLRQLTRAPAGRFQYLNLSFGPVPSRAEWEKLAGQQDAVGLHARAMTAELEARGSLPSTVAYPVQTWTFGDELAMVFLAGEVVADYGLRLKRELNPGRVWVNAYSNDVAFYVPSRRMIPEGGYEVERSMVYYGHPGPLAEGTEEQIVGAVTQMIRR